MLEGYLQARLHREWVSFPFKPKVRKMSFFFLYTEGNRICPSQAKTAGDELTFSLAGCPPECPEMARHDQ